MNFLQEVIGHMLVEGVLCRILLHSQNSKLAFKERLTRNANVSSSNHYQQSRLKFMSVEVVYIEENFFKQN